MKKDMKKIEIVEDLNLKEEVIVQMTENDLLSLIKKEGLIYVLQNYEVPESFILKWGKSDSEYDGIPKSIVISMLNLSENFIKQAIEVDYFELEDIYELNMLTYSNLSEKFIKIYEKYINWERMILYLCSSDKIENIDKFEWIIEKFDLWKLISASELSIDFIRKNRAKLDWRIVSIINEFSEENRQEFSGEIPDYKEEWDEYWEENPTSPVFSTEKLLNNNNLSVKDIRKIIKENVDEDNRFEVKHTMDDLSSDDIDQIKRMIQSGQVNNF
jgi:hypothetical protein